MGTDNKHEDAKRYKSPECWRLTREQMLRGTTEDFARWKAEALSVQECNTEQVQARAQARREIEERIAQAWPRGSEGFKVMMRALGKTRIENPQNFVRMLDDLEKDAARWREEVKRKTVQDAEGARKLLAAGAFLSARGKVVGVDYEAREAIDMANEIAIEEAIAEQRSAGGFISFAGDDNCSGCSGWDMESHRCECETRRVGWEHYGDFESISVYAQAN